MNINEPSRNIGKTERLRQYIATCTPLTEEEFATEGLAECWRGFAFWDKQGDLTLVATNPEAIKYYKSIGINTPL